MQIVTRNSYDPPFTVPQESHAIVFCDVFRASTTLLTVLSQAPSRVVLTNDEDTARRWTKEGAVLFSEVFAGGYDNSPSQARSLNLKDKVIVHKSTNLSNAIFHNLGLRNHSTRGFIGGFVNMTALVAHLQTTKFEHVELVAASHFARHSEAVEDVSCIQMFASRCRGENLTLPMRTDISVKISEKKNSGRYAAHYFDDCDLALAIDSVPLVATIKLIDDHSMDLQLVQA